MNKFNCLWTNLVVVVVVVYFFNLFFSCSDWITIWWTSGSFREWVPEENLWAEILHCKYNSSAQVPRIVVQCSCGMAHQKYQDGSFKPLKVQITLFSRAKETIISHFCTSLIWNYHNKKKPLALTVSSILCCLLARLELELLDVNIWRTLPWWVSVQLGQANFLSLTWTPLRSQISTDSFSSDLEMCRSVSLGNYCYYPCYFLWFLLVIQSVIYLENDGCQ